MTRNSKPSIKRPRPDMLRQPTSGFGWLEQALLTDRWFARIGVNATAVLVLLALAADRHGASFYSRHRIADVIGIALSHVDDALQRLRDLDLVDFMPWKPGAKDGVWQLLPLPPSREAPRANRVLSIGQILATLGMAPRPDHAAACRRIAAPTTDAE